jgi:hypothetical protein
MGRFMPVYGLILRLQNAHDGIGCFWVKAPNSTVKSMENSMEDRSKFVCKGRISMHRDKNGHVNINYRALMEVKERIENYVFLAFWEKIRNSTNLEKLGIFRMLTST